MFKTKFIMAIVALLLTVFFLSGVFLLEGKKADNDTRSQLINNKENNKIPISPKGIIGSIMWEEKKSSSYNILLLGGDKVCKNTDTMMLVNYSASGKIKVLSIPRDTRVVIKGKVRKINYAYPAGGAKLAVKTVSETLDVDIKYYLYVDIAVFKEVVDLLDGVEYYVPINMNYYDPLQNLRINLKKGLQVLDGRKAEQLVRYRKGYTNGDLDRILVQQDFVKELVRQKANVKYLPRIGVITKSIFKNIDTDIPLNEALKLSREAIKLSTDSVELFYTAR